MSWKTAYRSFYYAGAEEPDDIALDPETTALLVIDIQNTYLDPKDTPEETARWQPFYERMRKTVIPNTARLIDECRKRKVEVIFARIACLKPDGRDRSLSQKKPGFNYLLLPKELPEGQIVPELEPRSDEIVVTKTTDSALTGTNLRLILHNMASRTSSAAASSPTSASPRQCAALRMKVSAWSSSTIAAPRRRTICTGGNWKSST